MTTALIIGASIAAGIVGACLLGNKLADWWEDWKDG